MKSAGGSARGLVRVTVAAGLAALITLGLTACLFAPLVATNPSDSPTPTEQAPNSSSLPGPSDIPVPPSEAPNEPIESPEPTLTDIPAGDTPFDEG